MTEYIEREKAFDAVFGQFCASSDETEAALNAAIEEIRAIPAADVRPVVRGEWKVSVHKTYYDVSCSVCGINSFFQVDEKDSVSYANFCPNCGARMAEDGKA